MAARTTTPAQERVWRVIFMSDTPAGRSFDVALMLLVSLSVLAVVLESVATVRARYAFELHLVEWVFTLLFSAEYAARLWCVRDRRKYATSFFGVVDLLSILPTYLWLVLPTAHYAMAVRALRLLRIFRVFKMPHHLGEANVILNALLASRRKILVFTATILVVVLVEGTLIYAIEGHHNPDFANIPQSMYWAIVTLTTVGYGDITPVTIPGKLMASVVMLTGFSILAVPTGIVTAEIGAQIMRDRRDGRRCGECGHLGHEPHARHCLLCGAPLPAA